jgi:CubicO group peptidase (beta-lactamase class C family)
MSPLETFLAARVGAGCSPGFSWWVERGGSVVDHGAAGHAAVVPEARPATEDTPYDLASLTKPLATALVLSLLAGDGLVELDEPAERWAPELAGSCAGRATLRALARHEAGLPPWLPLYLEGRSIEAALEAIGRAGGAVEPGAILYSDLGYIVLGAVVERVAGRPLAELFRRRVAEPLALDRMRFATEPVPDAAATETGNAYERTMAGAAGARYAWRTDPIAGRVHDENAHALGGAAGHAGLFGTAREVARVAREILAPSVLPLARSARDEMLRSDGVRRTVGFDVAARARAARGILPPAAPGHTGFTGTSVWLEPDRGAIHVLLANRVHPRVGPREFGWVRRGFHRIAHRSTAG